MPGLFGGGKKTQPTGGGGGGGAGAGAAKAALFTPEQVQKATTDYTQRGTAKWNQIMAGMGAGGGVGGPDLPQQIQTQAQSLGQKLGELTGASGYGSAPNVEDVLRSLEPGIGARYPIY